MTTRGGAATLVYLLVEHQSEPDRWMALRETLDVIHPHLPELRFLLDDLGRVPMEELEARPITDLGRLALLFLQRVRVSPELTADVLRWMSMLRRVFRGPRGRQALELLGEYTHAVLDDVPAALQATLEAGIGSEGSRVRTASAEQIDRWAKRAVTASSLAELFSDG